MAPELPTGLLSQIEAVGDYGRAAGALHLEVVSQAITEASAESLRSQATNEEQTRLIESLHEPQFFAAFLGALGHACLRASHGWSELLATNARRERARL